MATTRFAYWLFALGLLAGCAVGAATDLEEDPDLVDLDDAGTGEGGIGDAGNKDSGVGDGGSTDAGGSDDAGDGDVGDDGGIEDDGGIGDGGGEEPTCGPPNTCFAPTNVGKVSGDKGHDVISRQGTTAEWIKVRVTEDDEGFLAGPVPLRLRLTLISPPGTNFDLFAYYERSACGAPDKASTRVGSVDDINLQWGEDPGDLLANGKDDDQDILIEVRWVSGECPLTQPWQLMIEGNSF